MCARMCECVCACVSADRTTSCHGVLFQSILIKDIEDTLVGADKYRICLSALKDQAHRRSLNSRKKKKKSNKKCIQNMTHIICN